MEQYLIITFDNTHHAIACEKELLSAGLSIRMMPVPRELTADCGLSLRFETPDLDKVLHTLKNLVYSGLFRAEKNGMKKIFTPLDIN